MPDPAQYELALHVKGIFTDVYKGLDDLSSKFAEIQADVAELGADGFGLGPAAGQIGRQTADIYKNFDRIMDGAAGIESVWKRLVDGQLTLNKLSFAQEKSLEDMKRGLLNLKRHGSEWNELNAESRGQIELIAKRLRDIDKTQAELGSRTAAHNTHLQTAYNLLDINAKTIRGIVSTLSSGADTSKAIKPFLNMLQVASPFIDMMRRRLSKVFDNAFSSQGGKDPIVAQVELNAKEIRQTQEESAQESIKIATETSRELVKISADAAKSIKANIAQVTPEMQKVHEGLGAATAPAGQAITAPNIESAKMAEGLSEAEKATHKLIGGASADMAAGMDKALPSVIKMIGAGSELNEVFAVLGGGPAAIAFKAVMLGLSAAAGILQVSFENLTKSIESFKTTNFRALGSTWALADSVNNLQSHLGASQDEAIKVVSALSEVGFVINDLAAQTEKFASAKDALNAYGETVYRFSLNTGVSNEATAKFLRTFQMVGVSLRDSQVSLGRIVQLTKEYGLSANDLNRVLADISQNALEFKTLYGEKFSAQNFTDEFTKLAAAAKKAGVDMGVVNNLMQDLKTNPAKFVGLLGEHAFTDEAPEAKLRIMMQNIQRAQNDIDKVNINFKTEKLKENYGLELGGLRALKSLRDETSKNPMFGQATADEKALATFGERIDSIWQSVKKIAGAFEVVFVRLAGPVVEKVAKWLEGISDHAEEFANDLVEAFKSIWDMSQDLAPFFDIAVETFGTIVSFSKVIYGVFKNIYNFFEPIIKLGMAIFKFIEIFSPLNALLVGFKLVSVAIKWVWDGITGLVEKFIKFIKDNMPNSIKKIFSAITDVIKTVTEGFEKAYKIYQDIMGKEEKEKKGKLSADYFVDDIIKNMAAQEAIMKKQHEKSLIDQTHLWARNKHREYEITHGVSVTHDHKASLGINALPKISITPTPIGKDISSADRADLAKRADKNDREVMAALGDSVDRLDQLIIILRDGTHNDNVVDALSKVREDLNSKSASPHKSFKSGPNEKYTNWNSGR